MLNKKPMVLVLAGPNGSGKSTITQYLEKIGDYTNADDVVASTGISNEEATILVDKKDTRLLTINLISHLKQFYLLIIKWIF